MKKQLLAIAIGTAMAAPGAVLAEGPEVYGKINLSWDNVEPASPGSGNPGDNHQQEINSHQSYVGVRGSSELFPMGMTGFYQLEYQVLPESQGTVFMNRESFLGVESDFGTVKAGRFNSPMANLGRKVDQFSDYQWSDIAGIMRGQTRGSNYVGYTSPEFGRMLTFSIAGPTSEGSDVNDSGIDNTGLWDSFSSSLLFDLGGDIYAGLGYDYNLFQPSVANPGDGAFTSTSFAPVMTETRMAEDVGGDPLTTVDIVRFVAGADLDALQLGFLWQNAKGNEEAANLGGEEAEEDSFVLSAGFMITPDTKLMAQYADTSLENVDDNDFSQWTLGVDHRLGDRTKGYAYATNRDLDGDRQIGVFSLGAEHRF